MASRHQASGRFRMGRHSSSRRFADSAATLLAVLALAAVGSCARDRHLDRHHFVPADIVAEEPTAADVETESYLSSMRTGFKHHAMPHKGAPRGQNYPGRGRAPSAECDLCADSNWLFVLAAGGRTGSTTAMSMFDSVPGFEIGGEHGGVLDHEMHFMDQVVEYSSRPKTATAWKHRPEDLNALRCETQEKMRRLIFGANYRELSARARVVGFKEIRYTNMPSLHFIAAAFPCARFVFPHRARPLAEQHWAEGFGPDYAEEWVRAGRIVSRVHETFSNTTALLAVEGLTHEEYNAILADTLGVAGCRFNAVLHDNADHGYTMAREGHHKVLTGRCDLSRVDFHLRPEVLTANQRSWDALLAEATHGLGAMGR
mmetsp:Transcript_24989/g.64860  ORF Transcript_24989/g.64860 Transcript_24989/m.64860 type:complete len:372 (+) Transcript_24989:175-1290(+)